MLRRAPFLLLLAPHLAFAADVTVSPGMLDDAIANANAGDTIHLVDGYYGDVTIRGDHDAETSIVADGADARMRTVRFVNASGWRLSGARVSPSFAAALDQTTMISIDRNSHDVIVERCDLFTVEDDVAATWGAAEWIAASSGIGVSGPGSIVRANRLRNVGYGISVNRGTPNVQVLQNEIDSFSRDGLRGIGDFGLFEGNYVVNSYDVDDHHDDFFQSWSHGADGSVGTGEVRGVIIRGNTFLGSDAHERPFRGPAQGIGCFDGFFVDWVIENNVVIVDHWHGITLLGARDVRIVNNTVIDRLSGRPGPPWIDVSNHKDGRRSSGIVIRNNITTDLTLDADDSVEDHNAVIDDPAAYFVDVDAFDLHLADDSAAIDVGSTEDTPTDDHDGFARPFGAAPDLGAYEWHPPLPRDGGVEHDAGEEARDGGFAVDAGAPHDGGVGGPSPMDASVEDAAPSTTSQTPTADTGCTATHGSKRSGWMLLVLLVCGAISRRRRSFAPFRVAR